MASTPDSEIQALIDFAAQGFHDANATRYLSGIGLVLLLYDHILTFDDEVRLVWRARPSFAKRAFLINRYLVASVLIATAYYMNHYDDGSLISATSCRRFYGAASLLGVSSIGFGNVLVLLRVTMLWDRSRGIMTLLTIGFLVSFVATFSIMVVFLSKTLPHVYYQPFVRMCVTTVKAPVLPAVWASPMIFELLILICVCWNAIDRPRSTDTALTRVLRRDGITFFSALTCFRTLNLVLAVVARPTLVLVGVFFVWAMTTLVLNRSLLNIQKAATARVAIVTALDHTHTHSRGLSLVASKGSSATGILPNLNVLSRSESPFGIEAAPQFDDALDLDPGGGEDVDAIWRIELRERAVS